MGHGMADRRAAAPLFILAIATIGMLGLASLNPTYTWLRVAPEYRIVERLTPEQAETIRELQWSDVIEVRETGDSYLVERPTGWDMPSAFRVLDSAAFARTSVAAISLPRADSITLLPGWRVVLIVVLVLLLAASAIIALDPLLAAGWFVIASRLLPQDRQGEVAMRAVGMLVLFASASVIVFSWVWGQGWLFTAVLAPLLLVVVVVLFVAWDGVDSWAWNRLVAEHNRLRIDLSDLIRAKTVSSLHEPAINLPYCYPDSWRYLVPEQQNGITKVVAFPIERGIGLQVYLIGRDPHTRDAFAYRCPPQFATKSLESCRRWCLRISDKERITEV